ncbi:MAG: hypothetical protein R2847_10565 [Bacteroidia bacterium]
MHTLLGEIRNTSEKLHDNAQNILLWIKQQKIKELIKKSKMLPLERMRRNHRTTSGYCS